MRSLFSVSSERDVKINGMTFLFSDSWAWATPWFSESRHLIIGAISSGDSLNNTHLLSHLFWWISLPLSLQAASPSWVVLWLAPSKRMRSWYTALPSERSLSIFASRIDAWVSGIQNLPWHERASFHSHARPCTVIAVMHGHRAHRQHRRVVVGRYN